MNQLLNDVGLTVLQFAIAAPFVALLCAALWFAPQSVAGLQRSTQERPR